MLHVEAWLSMPAAVAAVAKRLRMRSNIVTMLTELASSETAEEIGFARCRRACWSCFEDMAQQPDFVL